MSQGFTRQFTGLGHDELQGLLDDDHTQYPLLAGRAGGQVLIGGTGTTDDLTFQTTSGVGASGADMHFKVGNNGATEALTIYNNGRVGIGTEIYGIPAQTDVHLTASAGVVLALSRGNGDTSSLLGEIRFGNNNIDTSLSNIYAYQDGANDASNLLFYTSPTGGVQTERLRITGTGLVGLGNVASPSAQLHVDQSSATAAIPVLLLDQADDSEEMIEFVGTIGVGNALEAVGAKTLTTTHFIKVTIPGGLTRYIPAGTIA